MCRMPKLKWVDNLNRYHQVCLLVIIVSQTMSNLRNRLVIKIILKISLINLNRLWSNSRIIKVMAQVIISLINQKMLTKVIIHKSKIKKWPQVRIKVLD